MKKIDMHIHAIIYRDEIDERIDISRPDSNDNFATAQQVIELYEKLGIEKGVLLPLITYEGTNRIITNEETYRIAREFPDVFYWFCCVEPRIWTNRGDTDLAYFLEHYKSLGAKGIGEVTSRLDFDDARVQNLFYHAQKLKMPLLFHIGAENEPYGLYDKLGLPLFEQALESYPDLTFIGHSAAFWAEISGDCNEQNRASYPEGPVTKGGRIPYLMNNYLNFCADISATSGYNAITRDPDFGYAFLEKFQDRLFYGTDICAYKDYVFFNMDEFLLRGIEQGKLSVVAYEKICRLNAKRFLFD